MVRLRTGLVVSIVALAGTSVADPVPPKPARLDSVVSPPGHSPGVVLHVSTPVTPTANAIPAVPPQPPRIAIDLPNTVLGPGITPPAGTPPFVRSVRIGQRDPSTVRVVLDLDHTTPFRIDTQGTTIRVVIVEENAKAPVPPPPPPKATAQITPTPPSGTQTAKATPVAPNRWLVKRRSRGRPVYLDYDPRDFKLP